MLDRKPAAVLSSLPVLRFRIYVQKICCKRCLKRYQKITTCTLTHTTVNNTNNANGKARAGKALQAVAAKVRSSVHVITHTHISFRLPSFLPSFPTSRLPSCLLMPSVPDVLAPKSYADPRPTYAIDIDIDVYYYYLLLLSIIIYTYSHL